MIQSIVSQIEEQQRTQRKERNPKIGMEARHQEAPQEIEDEQDTHSRTYIRDVKGNDVE